MFFQQIPPDYLLVIFPSFAFAIVCQLCEREKENWGPHLMMLMRGDLWRKRTLLLSLSTKKLRVFFTLFTPSLCSHQMEKNVLGQAVEDENRKKLAVQNVFSFQTNENLFQLARKMACFVRVV
jgi:hypothetical protein